MNQAPPPEEGYEAVRRRLRERGYLDGRIERFLLRDALQSRPAAKQVVGAALRASLLGGPVLAALACASVWAGNGPRLSGVDALLVWVYFLPLSAAALFLADLIAALVVAGPLRRRAPRGGDPLRAALLVGLPTLVYLGLLWWNRPRAGLAADLLFLSFAAAGAVLLAWLAALVSLVGVIGRSGQLPGGRRRRAALLAGAVLLPLAAIFLLVRGMAEPTLEASSFSVAKDRPPLMMIGVDGLDGELVEAFEARDELPRLMQLLESGTVFTRQRPPGAAPPQVWTTISTGLPPERHGVVSVGLEQLPGVATPLSAETGPIGWSAALRWLLPTTTVPATGAFRRVRTVWEIVSLRRPTLAVGWWASWPAVADEESRGGVWVTDRALPKLLSGAGSDRDTLPESLFARLAGEFDEDRRVLRREFETRFESVSDPRIRDWLWESYLIDGYAMRVARRLWADPDLAAGFVYLPGLDILRTRFEGRYRPDDVVVWMGVQQALEGYLGALDGWLGEARDMAGPGQWMLVGDPGRRRQPSEGFVAVVSDEATPACVGGPVDDLDLAPLALALLGYPLSRDWSGHLPVGGCLTVGEPERIATFGRRGVPEGTRASEYDEEMVERLRSLGYLN